MSDEKPPARLDRYDDREMVDTIKQTVCKGASDAQLRMFIEVCRSTGLNPFLKEIWYVADKGIIMAARDGYLRVANENPQFDGMETRVERDDNKIPIKAVCTVWRKDRGHPITCEAYFSEYKKAGPVWSQYPAAMISKVAEVLALKRSFAINGVVSEEEMGDGSGGRVAAQDVAQAKIAGTMPLVALPEGQEPAPTLAKEIVSVEQAKPRRRREKPYDKFTMFKAFDAVKARFEELGQSRVYYDVLMNYGAHKRSELPEDDGGFTAAAAYKELSLRVADLETYRKTHDYPDWEAALSVASQATSPIWVNGIEMVFNPEAEKYEPAAG